jgi:hypothetical protein
MKHNQINFSNAYFMETSCIQKSFTHQARGMILQGIAEGSTK